MKPLLAMSVAALTLVACRQEPRPEPIPGPPALAGQCDASKVQHIVGKVYTPALGQDARKRAGAKLLRALTPDMVVTMEYRVERLNIVQGTDGKIGSVHCG